MGVSPRIAGLRNSLRKMVKCIVGEDEIDALIVAAQQEGVEWAEAKAKKIVRCKNCIYYGIDYVGIEDAPQSCCERGNLDDLFPPSDLEFCSRGVRKEKDTPESHGHLYEDY